MKTFIKLFISSKHFSFAFLMLLFLLGFGVRLYRFDNPLADWHSWRQTDTSAVSRFFIQDGYDFLHPKYYDISKIQTGQSNPHGYRFVEFPIYNFFQAFFYQTFGTFTLEEWGRLVSIGSSLLSGLFIYLIVKKHIGKIEAYFSLFFFLFLPYSIYYSRTVLPDIMTVTAALGGIYCFDKYLSAQKKSVKIVLFFLAIVISAASLLLKPFAIFLLIPQFFLLFKKYGFKSFLKWEMYIYALLVGFPLAVWRIWMLQFPEGIPASLWLLNGDHIRFKGAYFHWIFGERIAKLIFGYYGISLLFFGFLKKEKEKNFLFSISFLLVALLYLIIVAKGNVQHDYYQIMILPALCIFAGRGAGYLLSLKGRVNKIGSIFIIALSISLAFSLSWFYVRDYFNINNGNIIIAGREADKILPKNAKVIAPLDGDTTFLYYINRQGWPAATRSPEDLKKRGATHMVIVNPTANDFSGYGKKYKVLASSSQYLILQL